MLWDTQALAINCCMLWLWQKAPAFSWENSSGWQRNSHGNVLWSPAPCYQCPLASHRAESAWIWSLQPHSGFPTVAVTDILNIHKYNFRQAHADKPLLNSTYAGNVSPVNTYYPCKPCDVGVIYCIVVEKQQSPSVTEPWLVIVSTSSLSTFTTENLHSKSSSQGLLLGSKTATQVR